MNENENVIAVAAQAAVEAQRQLARLELIHEIIFTVKTEKGGVSLRLDRQGQITIFKP